MNLPIPTKLDLSEHWQDRLLRFVQFGTGLVILLVAFISYGAMTGAWSAANNSDQVRRGNEIAACRTQTYAEAEAAAGALDRARADLDVLVATGLEAALRDDAAAMADVLARIDAATALVADRAHAAGKANDAYSQAAQLAADNPDQFLRNCNPGG